MKPRIWRMKAHLPEKELVELYEHSKKLAEAHKLNKRRLYLRALYRKKTAKSPASLKSKGTP
jgi:hypothetical protein